MLFDIFFSLTRFGFVLFVVFFFFENLKISGNLKSEYNDDAYLFLL